MIPREEELIYRTRWLVRVRWFVVLSMGMGALASHLFGLAYPVQPLLLVAGFVAIYNVLFAVVARWSAARPVELVPAYRFINLQIVADFLALLAWVHYTGGPTSPFLPFFVFHLVICALLVSQRMVFIHAGWVFVVLLAMGVSEARKWLPHCPPLEAGVTRPIDSVRYLISIGVVTIVTFVTISVVVGGIASRLRRREVELDEVQRELERHASEVEAAHARLKKLDQDRSAFFRLVSHQLRSPLSSIQTVLKLVTGGYAEEPEKAAELVARAELQSQHMLAMLNDMLSLTRVREAAQVEAPEMVALGPMIADVVEASQNAALAKKIKLTADIDSELPSISAIRNHIKQLFAVLVENAVKYTPEGGTIEVAAGYDKGEVRVAVKDTGIGIPAEDAGQVFDEFYRASNARQHERVGTGLGLSIAKKVADDLGGRIEVASVVGRGTTFTIILPVASGEPTR